MNDTHQVGAGLRPAHRYNADAGQALPLALVALAVGITLITVLILAVGVYMQLSGRSASDLLDYYTCDAGIERAIVPLVSNPLAYPSNSTLTVSLNNRSATVGITPLGSQVISEPGSGGTITTTVTSYLVASTTGNQTITSRVEARQAAGQATASLRITAWEVGQ